MKLNAALRLLEAKESLPEPFPKGSKVVFTVTDGGKTIKKEGRIIDGPWKPKAGTSKKSLWYRVRGIDNIRYSPVVEDIESA